MQIEEYLNNDQINKGYHPRVHAAPLNAQRATSFNDVAAAVSAMCGSKSLLVSGVEVEAIMNASPQTARGNLIPFLDGALLLTTSKEINAILLKRFVNEWWYHKLRDVFDTWVDNLHTPVDNVGIGIRNTPKYVLGGHVPETVADADYLAILPSDDLNHIVDYEHLDTIVANHRYVYIKPHPGTSTKMLNDLRRRYGDKRVLQPQCDVTGFLRNGAKFKLATTTATEMGFMAIRAGVQIVDITDRLYYHAGQYSNLYQALGYITTLPNGVTIKDFLAALPFYMEDSKDLDRIASTIERVDQGISDSAWMAPYPRRLG